MAVGHPKYNYGDIVKFKWDGDDNPPKTGIIAIIDRYGTFFDDSDVSYDIMVKDENMLYKHYREDSVIEKIGEVPEDKIWD